MPDLAEQREKRRISSLAREYRSKGYGVIVNPQRDELPAFLKDFRIDLLVRSAEENIVVEVKTRSSLSKATELPVIAGLLENRPGWRLDLVVTNPRYRSPFDERAQPLASEDIVDRLRQVDNLLQQEYIEAAMLLAWSAAEAALRLVAARNEVKLKEQFPVYVVDQLYSLGLLDKEQRDTLRTAERFRTSLVHGLKTDGIAPDIVKRIAAISDELLNC